MYSTLFLILFYIFLYFYLCEPTWLIAGVTPEFIQFFFSSRRRKLVDGMIWEANGEQLMRLWEGAENLKLGQRLTFQ